MAGGRKFLSNVIDYGSLVTAPIGGLQANAAYTAFTGETLGEAATGEKSHLGMASDASGYSDIFGKQSKADSEAFQREQTINQQTKAASIAAELEEQGRPTMEAAVDRQREIAQIARRYAQEGMPEAQRQMAEDNIARSQAQSLAGASSMGAGLRGLGGTQATTVNAYRGLAAQDAQMANNNRTQYLNSLGTLGGLEGQAEQYNTLLPYEQKLSEMQAMQAAALQNQWGMYQSQIAQGQVNQQLAMDGAGMAIQAAPLVASDIRLKENISHTGYSESGISTYTWNYKGDVTTRYKGVMAQDLLQDHPQAVVIMPNGYYGVDYSIIDVRFERV
tara:strand:+ start:94 stop:1089 length:996 start_codon:yes stop_codon:yes gene_type:complete